MEERTDIINSIIKAKGYKSYLEIGVNEGMNFDFIDIPHKVGNDPFWSSDYRMPSDQYFAENPDHRYDLIFIDGLHIYEQALRDLQNSLKILNPGGMIVMHDCRPMEAYQATDVRIGEGSIWLGTVWKAVLHARLTKLADISVIGIETGIGIITKRSEVEFIDVGNIIHDAIASLKYEFLETHRQEILNVISLDDFRRIFLNG